MKRIIKVCINPHCEEVAHNCDKKETHCRNCDYVMIAISPETYQQKYAANYFQYDYQTGELTNAKAQGYSMQLALAFS